MNFTAVARELFYKDGKSVKNLIEKNIDNEELKPYLIYQNGKLKGIKQEGLEVLRGIGHQYTTKAKATANNQQKSNDMELMELQHKIELLEIKNNSLERFNQELEKDKERLIAENEQLKAELKEYRGAGFFKRLLGYKG